MAKVPASPDDLVETIMPDAMPSLWPPEIKVDVQTPLAILRVQASHLNKVTRGIMRGDVETETSPRRWYSIGWWSSHRPTTGIGTH